MARGMTEMTRSLLSPFWFVMVRHALVPEGHYMKQSTTENSKLAYRRTWSLSATPDFNSRSLHKSNRTSSTMRDGGVSRTRVSTCSPARLSRSYFFFPPSRSTLQSNCADVSEARRPKMANSNGVGKRLRESMASGQEKSGVSRPSEVAGVVCRRRRHVRKES